MICYGTNGVVLLDVKSGAEIQQFAIPQSFPDHDSGGWITDRIMLSHDGKRLVVQNESSTRSGTRLLVALWNTDAGELIKQFSEDAMVWEMIIGFSPRDENFMLFDKDGKPELFDGATGERLKILEQFQQR